MSDTFNPEKLYDQILHVKGESVFVDDIAVPEGTLYASVFYSEIAFGKILGTDLTHIMGVDNVFVLTAEDIPGENQIGNIIPDESLFASNEVQYAGQPIGIVVSPSDELSKDLAKKIKIKYDEYYPILDAREAQSKNSLIIPVKVFEAGNIEKAIMESDYVFEDSVEFGGQEHLYMETQSSLSIPIEGEKIKIYSSTQSPTAVQRTVANVLNVSQNNIEVDVLRLGGAFGGKEDQATAWAVMSALAAFKLRRPVKIILDRPDDLRMTGKRHPYSIDFRIGLTKKYKILGYEVTFFQNAGASADLSPAVLDRTLFHCNGSYYIPNLKATGYSCRTNLPPNTAFRGFGAPQGIYAIESAIIKAAFSLNVEPEVIQERNLIKEGVRLHYGQIIKNCKLSEAWKKLKKNVNPELRKSSISKFNKSSNIFKKSYSFIPLTFGISFTNIMMNQASSLVNIYSDGSVGVSTAAVEMGQGVNTKIRQVAASVFGIDIDRIKTESTNTSRVANTSPTAASTGADLNGMATLLACIEIKKRIKNFLSKKYKLDIKKNEKLCFANEYITISKKKLRLYWNDVITVLLRNRISLSAHYNYVTPFVKFDYLKKKGNPFAYHTYGAAYAEVTVDTRLGKFRVNEVNLVHDSGNPLNRLIDTGQIEGALIQGIGMMTLEEVMYNEKGKLISDSLSKYKVPDIYFTPEKIHIEFLKNDKNLSGILGSKAVGEPPLIYGLGVYFAIISAITNLAGANLKFVSPLTNERIFTCFHNKRKNK